MANLLDLFTNNAGYGAGASDSWNSGSMLDKLLEFVQNTPASNQQINGAPVFNAQEAVTSGVPRSKLDVGLQLGLPMLGMAIGKGTQAFRKLPPAEIESLFNRFYSKDFPTIARSLTKDSQIHEDLINEAALAAHTQLQEGLPTTATTPEAINNYLHAIGRNSMLRMLKREHEIQNVSTDIGSEIGQQLNTSGQATKGISDVGRQIKDIGETATVPTEAITTPQQAVTNALLGLRPKSKFVPNIQNPGPNILFPAKMRVDAGGTLTSEELRQGLPQKIATGLGRDTLRDRIAFSNDKYQQMKELVGGLGSLSPAKKLAALQTSPEELNTAINTALESQTNNPYRRMAAPITEYLTTDVNPVELAKRLGFRKANEQQAFINRLKAASSAIEKLIVDSRLKGK